jgi:hypothetical protein
MLPLRSVLRTRTPLLLRNSASAATSPLLSTGLALSLSSRRTLRTSGVVGQPEKKWVNQRPAKEAKEGDKPVKGPGGEVITSDGTTKENAPGLRANLGMTLEEDEPPEQFVTSNTGATAIFGNDKELPVDASELVFPEDELVGQGARPWELDDKFDAEGDTLMGGHSRRSEGVGASKVGSKVDDEPKSPLEHEEVDTVLEDIVTGPTSAPRTSATAAATSSPLSSSTKASSSSPSSSASLSSNQDNSTPSSSSSNNSSSSSNNGSSSSGGNNNNNNNSGNNNDGGDSPPPPPKTGKEVAKVSIPDEYPQVLALPITRRPLFPGELHWLS